MNPCDHCPIDDKIFECCGRHPETSEVAVLSIRRNRKRIACPNLSESGKCGVYANRPFACQAHYCSRYQGFNNGMAGGFQAMRAGMKGFDRQKTGAGVIRSRFRFLLSTSISGTPL